MKSSIIKKLITNIDSNTPCILLTRLEDGFQKLIEPQSNNIDYSDIVNRQAIEVYNNKKSVVKKIEKENWFFKVYNIQIKIIILGAVHITQTLVKLADLMGFKSVIIDPRSTFINDPIYKNLTILKEWPDEALKKIKIDKNTAIVTLTHDPKLDDVMLKSVLKTEAFYIGSLGSEKTHLSRIIRLEKLGFEKKLIEKIYGPIGLDMNTKSPEEIALSIITQITMINNKIGAQN